MTPDELRQALRLIVITDRRLAAPRSIEYVVAQAIEAGARIIQLRDKQADSYELLAWARRLLRVTRPAGALLFVNDRVDVALTARADGVHIGRGDLPVRTVCGGVPEDFLVGVSADDPEDARRAQGAGAAYVGCGAVFGTTTKDVGDEAIGLGRLDEVARSVSIPVLAIGGVTTDRATKIAAETAAWGTAVVGAVMGAEDPAGVVRALLAAFDRKVDEKGKPPGP